MNLDLDGFLQMLTSIKNLEKNKLIKIFIKKDGEHENLIQIITSSIIVLSILIHVFYYSLSRIGIVLDFSVLLDYKYRLLKGFITTIEISLVSLVLSLAIGFISALGNNSKIIPVSYLCKVYVQFIRGTPMIMQVYLFFYIIGTAWGITNRFMAGVLILSIFEGAYISEIIRGGMESIDGTQLEAAKAVGFDSRQTMRFIILPQIATRSLPSLAGQFASIIKDSSLLSLISVIELTQTIREISATNFAIFECYIFLGFLYLILTYPLSLFTRWLERRFSYDN